MRGVILFAALLWGLPVRADCFGLAGALLNRYQASPSGLTRDGTVTASAGAACQMVTGKTWGIDAGAFGGSVIADVAHPLTRPVVGAYVAIDYAEAVSVGLAPHWETGQPFNLASSWAVGLMVTTRFGEIGDVIASWFSDGIQEGAAIP